MSTLLQSKFETYLLDEDLHHETEASCNFEQQTQEQKAFPEGFFTEL